MTDSKPYKKPCTHVKCEICNEYHDFREYINSDVSKECIQYGKSIIIDRTKFIVWSVTEYNKGKIYLKDIEHFLNYPEKLIEWLLQTKSIIKNDNSNDEYYICARTENRFVKELSTLIKLIYFASNGINDGRLRCDTYRALSTPLDIVNDFLDLFVKFEIIIYNIDLNIKFNDEYYGEFIKPKLNISEEIKINSSIKDMKSESIISKLLNKFKSIF